MRKFLARLGWHEAPSVADLMQRLIDQRTKIMSALTDLQSAIADLSTALTANNAEIDTLLTKIVATGTSDADVEAAVASIRALITSNAAEVAKAQQAAP